MTWVLEMLKTEEKNVFIKFLQEIYVPYLKHKFQLKKN